MARRLAVSVLVLGMAVLGASASAFAAPILIIRDFAGGPPPPNDCAGIFGKPETPCDVGFALDPPAEVSPWIAKYETDSDSWETNNDFPSVTGDEFTIVGANGGSGTWSYTPGLGDPGVRFWVAKGGNEGFRLHWMVEGTTVGNTCDGDPYNLACLNLALVVTSGDWDTTNGQDLSHLTFYDTGNVPEPLTLSLFGAGALAVGLARRRRNR